MNDHPPCFKKFSFVLDERLIIYFHIWKKKEWSSTEANFSMACS
jgi:hypothetical protein